MPINIQSTEYELGDTLTFCSIDIVLTERRYNHKIEKACERTNSSIRIINIDDYDDAVILDKASDEIPKKVPAIIFSSSGSTSNPKKIMLSESNIYSIISAKISMLDYRSDDIGLIVLPMSSVYANIEQFLLYIHLGISFVLGDTLFSAKGFLKTVQEHHITLTECVPSVFDLLCQYPYIDRYVVSSLRLIGFGGSPSSILLLRKIYTLFPNAIFLHSYGQTESTSLYFSISHKRGRIE